MFHVDMTLYERGESRVIFGVGARCDEMRGRWQAYPQGFRILLPNDDLPQTMASAVHRDRVEGYIAKGKTEARLVTGGGRPKGRTGHSSPGL